MGVVVADNEPVMEDPYIAIRQMNLQREIEKSKIPSLASDGRFAEEKLRKFLEYDPMVLRYAYGLACVWNYYEDNSMILCTFVLSPLPITRYYSHH